MWMPSLRAMRKFQPVHLVPRRRAAGHNTPDTAYGRSSRTLPKAPAGPRTQPDRAGQSVQTQVPGHSTGHN
eukprot:2231533-Alexandrium_andersonii.AAC.1